ncbi:MAG: hypothetical protein ACLR8Y_19705 [Alistipes indistinctus]
MTALGNDPIDVEDAWFGGNYLNVNFFVFRFDPSLAHFINLLVDEQNSTADNVVVILKHNAYGDPATSLAFGRVSFDISGLVPAGQKSVKITLKWTNYNNVERSDSGIFYPLTILLHRRRLPAQKTNNRPVQPWGRSDNNRAKAG